MYARMKNSVFTIQVHCKQKWVNVTPNLGVTVALEISVKSTLRGVLFTLDVKNPRHFFMDYIL